MKTAANRLGVLWCLIHFALEIICFQYYTFCFGSTALAAVIAFIYDVIAFFPQFLIGAAVEKHSQFPVGKTGAALVLLGACTAFCAAVPLRITGLIVLSAGNAFVHVGGAEATLFTCREKIAPSAVFVAGGAAGVGIGKILGARLGSVTVGLLVMCAASVLICMADSLMRKTGRTKPEIRMADPRRNPAVVVWLAFFVVTVRGMLAYGIPTGWVKSWQQTLALFMMMAVGKAAGGICSDRFGAKKTALLSTGLSVPLLLLGAENMTISLVGIMFFSMTMASTLGILVSAAPDHPLVAYGMTTVGLLLGTLSAVFPGVRDFLSQGIVLTVLSVLCFAALFYIMRPDREDA